MVYKYRITLQGIKGFYRVYLVNGENSLYTFHKQIRSDLEFPVDQPILFKALDEEGQVVARYALVDIGYGAVDAVTIADTIKAGAASFIYFYDIQAKKSVIITLGVERVLTVDQIHSQEFENGYVAFEDLPAERRRLPGESLSEDDEDEDDDDEDEDEDDDSKEEEEIIYDEEEA